MPCRWYDNIKMDFPRNGMGWGDMVWIDVAQDRNMWRDFVIAVMKQSRYRPGVAQRVPGS